MQKGIRDIRGSKILPGIQCSRGDLIKVILDSTGAVDEGEILVQTGFTNGHIKVGRADADSLTTARGRLFVATHDVPVQKLDKPQLEASTWAVLVGYLDTSLATVGDPVYLSSTAGDLTLTSPSPLTAVRRVVGWVVRAHASEGVIFFDGSADAAAPKNDLGKIVSGTGNIAIGQSTLVVAVGAALNGKPVTAVVMQAAADATLTHVERANITGGNLTVYGNANATAQTAVSYIIDGR